MFHQLLVPLDGTDASLKALDVAIPLARALEAKIHVFHAIPSYPARAYLAALIHSTKTLYEEEAAAHAGTFLGEARDRATAAGIACSSSITFAPHADEAIVATAAEYRCDLIVMASFRRGGINRHLLGSDTYGVLIHSDIPVMVCS